MILSSLYTVLFTVVLVEGLYGSHCSHVAVELDPETFSKYESFTLQSMLLSGPGLKTPEFPFNKVGTKTFSLYLSINNSKNFLLHFLHFNTNKPVLKM